MSTHLGSKNKILIVDDDKFLTGMYSIKFKNAGFEVEVANDGMAALDRLRAGYVPDVMLLDVVMPGLDGLELIHEIQKAGYAPKALLIVLSNQSAQDDIEKAKNLSIAGYIVKATTIPSEVVTEVSRIIKEHESK